MSKKISGFTIKTGGRKPGSLNRRTRQAIEICEALDFHPAAFLATIALTGQMPNPDGTTTPVAPEERTRAAIALAPFVMPKLQATSTQISNPDGGPVEVLDWTSILANPEMAEAAEKLALAAAMVPDPEHALPAPEDLATDLEKTQTGHWAK